jgi:hypothetical protein
MGVIEDTRIVVVQDDDNGVPRFLDDVKPFIISVPGVVHGGNYWGTLETPALPDKIGAVPTDGSFPPPGGTTFGIHEWAPHSDGKFDASALMNDDVEAGADGDPAMHASRSIDYEYIISGKVDIEFPGGLATTLHSGDLLVMGGSAHAWKNRYDEPCRFLAIIIGATRQ